MDPYKQALKIEDIYFGYAFLLDKQGIIRWQGQGFAKAEDVKSLIETATRTANEKWSARLVQNKTGISGAALMGENEDGWQFQK